MFTVKSGKMRQTVVTETKYVARKPEELLSPSDLATLSKTAVKVYTAVWNLMAFRKVNQIWAYDHELKRRALVSTNELYSAQTELSKAGLLSITFGTAQTLYSFNDDK